MEELVDIFDSETGKKTGLVISKSEAHKNGLWHSSIHIWLISPDKKRILLQRRCDDKNLFPDMWDITVGGHISAGEEPIESAKRELQEELGLNPDNYEFKYIKTIKEEFKDHDVYSNEFVNIYIIEADVDINDITLQKEEVSEARWFTKEELIKLEDDKKVLPHIEEFIMIKDILK